MCKQERNSENYLEQICYNNVKIKTIQKLTIKWLCNTMLQNVLASAINTHTCQPFTICISKFNTIEWPGISFLFFRYFFFYYYKHVLSMRQRMFYNKIKKKKILESTEVETVSTRLCIIVWQIIWITITICR